MRNALELGDVYRLLEPGPVVLLTTARRGKPNVMAMSWHMMVEFEPPMVACVVSNGDFSFAALTATKACMIAVPGVELAEKVVAVGNCSGRNVDKFATHGLTPVKAEGVMPPLVGECFANLACRVVETRLVRRLNLFVLEVTQAWAEPGWETHKTIHHKGWGAFAVDGQLIRLESKMP